MSFDPKPTGLEASMVVRSSGTTLVLWRRGQRGDVLAQDQPGQDREPKCLDAGAGQAALSLWTPVLTRKHEASRFVFEK